MPGRMATSLLLSQWRGEGDSPYEPFPVVAWDAQVTRELTVPSPPPRHAAPIHLLPPPLASPLPPAPPTDGRAQHGGVETAGRAAADSTPVRRLREEAVKLRQMSRLDSPGLHRQPSPLQQQQQQTQADEPPHMTEEAETEYKLQNIPARSSRVQRVEASGSPQCCPAPPAAEVSPQQGV
jgi:hypothetical protein